MPVRSLNSSVLRWPDRHAIHDAVCRWAERIGQDRADVIDVGYFGSYARGDWGVGSDLDLVVIVGASDTPFLERPLGFDTTWLPVPADLLVYTAAEWEADDRPPFLETIRREAVWVTGTARHDSG